MAMHVPTHSELVTWIDAFEGVYRDELGRPIDSEALATCLEKAVNGAQVDDVRDWVRTSAEWQGKHTPPAASEKKVPVGDMIAPQEITFVGGPNIGAWPPAATITRLSIRLDGVEVDFTKRDGPDRWPDARTPGWSGDLQYSLGMCLRLGERWYASAPIETWYGNNVIGGPIQATNVEGSGIGQIPKNWFYDRRWAPMNGYQPKAGEMIGLFVCAGDARNNFNPVQERSNIVLVPLPPEGQAATFSWEPAQST
jgi:hypothetical protein